MKRLITAALLVLPVLFACQGTSGTGSSVASGVVLNPDNLNIVVGESAVINATVQPASLKMGVVWSVIDPDLASVNEGTVTGLAEGVTYVVATSADGAQKAACMVNVTPRGRYNVIIRDELGETLSGVYGYPGQSMKLSAFASDGKSHTFKWSIDNPEAASITSDGVLTLAAKASGDNAFAYDAEATLMVETEDGSGCVIPVRSSILKGIRVGGIYTPAGTPAIVQESRSYPIAALYKEENGQAAIPVVGAKLELSNTADFTLQEVSGEYKLVTGETTGASTKVLLSLPGSAEKVDIARIKIDKVYGIAAQFAGSSSSTLTFTWTKGVSEEQDVANPYTVYLYNDEECTSLEASFSIPAGDACWRGKQPRFVFSGLTPGTEYFFKVAQTDDPAKVDSALIPATTDDFNIVMVSSEPASVGDIILAEDFGQFCWGPDEISHSAGYWVTDSEPKWDTNVGASYSSRDAHSFAGPKGSYSGACWHAQKSANKAAGFRLSTWAQGKNARVYLGPGYVFLSVKGYGTHIITPKLNSIPEGQTAKLKLILHAAGMAEGNEALLAVQHGISFNDITASTTTNKEKLDLTSNIKTITYSGGLTTLSEFEVILEGVANGDRIAFGPTTETADSNSNMMILSDITIEIVELAD